MATKRGGAYISGNTVITFRRQCVNWSICNKMVYLQAGYPKLCSSSGVNVLRKNFLNTTFEHKNFVSNKV